MDALALLQKLAGGKLMEKIHAAILQVAEEVVTTEKKGTVTVTLEISKVGEMPAVAIAEQIKVGLPVPKARGALFFAIGDGELHISDPRQLPMEFRMVEDRETGVRTLADDQGDVRDVR